MKKRLILLFIVCFLASCNVEIVLPSTSSSSTSENFSSVQNSLLSENTSSTSEYISSLISSEEKSESSFETSDEIISSNESSFSSSFLSNVTSNYFSESVESNEVSSMVSSNPSLSSNSSSYSSEVTSEITSEQTSISSLISSIFSSDIASSEFSSNIESSSMSSAVSSVESSTESSDEFSSILSSSPSSSFSSETTSTSSSSEESLSSISSSCSSSNLSSITSSELSSISGTSMENSSLISSSVTSSSEESSSSVLSNLESVSNSSETSLFDSDSTITSSESSSMSSSSEDIYIPEEEMGEFTLDSPLFQTPIIDTIENVTFDDLFNLGNKVTIKAYMSEQELGYLAEDQLLYHKDQTYHRCDKLVISLKNYDQIFTWEFENVGIRQKGNTSRKTIYNEEGELNLNHFKFSFDETFTDPEHYDDLYISEHGNMDYESREFLNTLGGLDLKWNKNYDLSYIKEVYTSYIYQAAGIISGHIGLAEFSIVEVDKDNKETSMGLCSLYEPTGKSLIKRTLKNDNKSYVNMGTWKEEKAGLYGVEGQNYGDYYECGYGWGEGFSGTGADFSFESISGNKIGIGDNYGENIPAYERKTNTDIYYEDNALKNLIEVVNNGTYRDIANVIDLEEFAIKEAITYFIGNPDGMRYYNNNYLIYFRRTDGKAIIIPKDNDRCFGITTDLNLRSALKNEKLFTPIDRDEGIVKNKLFLKTILSNNNNQAKEKYQEAVLAIINSEWASNSTFETYYQIASKTYSDYEFSLEDTNISFDEYVTSKIIAVNKSFSPDIREILFQNRFGWAEVQCYAWIKDGENASLELVELSLIGKKDGADVYRLTADVNKYTHVIFCNGELGEYNQSAKIEATYLPYESNLIYLEGWYVTELNFYHPLIIQTNYELIIPTDEVVN